MKRSLILAATAFGLGVGLPLVVTSVPTCTLGQSSPPDYTYRATVINVVDGDTIDVIVDLGFRMATTQRLRLARVDTPERNQQGYAEAKALTERIASGKAVTIRTTKVSKWGYYLAEVTVDGQNISDALLQARLARPYDGGTK